VAEQVYISHPLMKKTNFDKEVEEQEEELGTGLVQKFDLPFNLSMGIGIDDVGIGRAA